MTIVRSGVLDKQRTSEGPSLRLSYVPSPPAIFVGRQSEIARVEEMLTRVKVAVIYGVGGVGKSTLAYAVAARWTRPIVHHAVVGDEPLAALVDDVRRQLARGPVPEITREDERTLSLARKLDESETLLLLDDIHRLDARSRTPFVELLSRTLRRGRVIATSRELVSADAAEADRFELRLEGLDLANARALWSSLDELYGPSGGFEEAWVRSRGNPFLLRRAHAGGLEDDPVAATVASLSPDEHLLAGLLAIAEIPLPTRLVLSVLPQERARIILRQLVTRMIVTLDEPRGCALHDLFRGPVCDSLTADERRRLHEILAHRLEVAPLDPVVRIREVTRQLRSMGNYAEAGTYLLEHSRQLVRHGATGELLRALEAIPAEHRSFDVRICHARTLGRLLDLPRSYLELQQLSEEAPQNKFDLKVALGNVAMLTANLSVAERVLTDVLGQRDLSWALRTRATVLYGLTLTAQGRGAQARALLAEAEQRTSHSLDRGYLSICLGFSLWFDGQLAAAEEPVLRARMFFEKESASFRAANYVPFFLTALFANLGKLKQASEALEQSELSLKNSEDLRMRAVVRVTRAIYCFEAGQRSAAIEELAKVHATFERAGETLNCLWTECWMARCLLLLGHRREGLQLAERAELEIRRHGILPFLRLLQRAREDDPIAQVTVAESRQPDSNKRSEVVRARALAALRAASSGDSRAADALQQLIAAEVTNPDYALDRAIAQLARATTARLQGCDDEAMQLIPAAVVSAKEGAVDVDLIPDLLRALGCLRTVTPQERRVASEAPASSNGAVAIDGRAHLIRFGRTTVSLARRPVLRRLLYGLALRPNATVAKERLAQAIWQCAYHPLRHDNALKVNVRELRRLLAGSKLSVEFDGMGYRLSVPEGFIFFDELWASAEPERASRVAENVPPCWTGMIRRDSAEESPDP